ncbi:MAG: hypothetical protein RL192_765, partial [Actinomycetota bacterium]
MKLALTGLSVIVTSPRSLTPKDETRARMYSWTEAINQSEIHKNAGT